MSQLVCIQSTSLSQSINRFAMIYVADCRQHQIKKEIIRKKQSQCQVVFYIVSHFPECALLSCTSFYFILFQFLALLLYVRKHAQNNKQKITTEEQAKKT